MLAAKPNRTAPTWNAGSRANGDIQNAAGTNWHGQRQMGLKTLSDHFQELGADFGEEIERRASDAKLILDTAAKYGVPVDMLWKPSGSSSLQAPALTPPPVRESGVPAKS